MKEKVNLKVKRNIVASCLAVCIIVLIIILARTKTDTKIASKQVEAKAITISAGTKNSNNYTDVKSEDGILVPVPKGYVASPDVEERYVNGVTAEDGTREHHGGFVIYEKNAGETDEQVAAMLEDDIDTAQRERNQWVWVPIEDVADMYHTSGNLIYANTYTFNSSSYSKSTSNNKEPVLQTDLSTSSKYDYDQTYLKLYLEGISRNEFLQELREEFYEMIKSVKTYGGYYIGRYTTGNINQNVPVVVKENNNISNVQWHLMYKRSKNLKGTNKAVETGMIWGIQWDETLRWLIDSGEKTYAEINDSTTWGNYKNNTVSGRGSLRVTGYSESWKASNIYDLAGNVFEWTMEYFSQYGGSRYCRGGSYRNDGTSGAFCRNNVIPSVKYDFIGCRTVLYII